MDDGAAKLSADNNQPPGSDRASGARPTPDSSQGAGVVDTREIASALRDRRAEFALAERASGRSPVSTPDIGSRDVPPVDGDSQRGPSADQASAKASAAGARREQAAKHVVVTRAEGEDGPLSSQLRELGLPVLLWPAVSVAVAETGARRLHRVWLTGDRAGTSELFGARLSGYPDNIALGSDGLIWIAVPAPASPQLRRVQALPKPVRTLLTTLPPRLQPAAEPTVSAVAVDDDGRVVHEFRGRIEGFRFLTGVRERDGRLWLGSLEGGAIGMLDIAAS